MDKFIRNLYKELKDSRLWPVAAVLALALVAVPLLLSKPSKETAAPGAVAQPVGPAGGASPLSELKPIAEVRDASQSTERRSINRLPARNPFTPLKEDSADSGSEAGGASAPSGTTGPVGETPGGTVTGGDTGTGTGTGSTGSGTTGSTGGGSSGSGEQPVFYYTFVADVTFGKVDDTTRRQILQLRALPSSDLPVIVFMGATADGDKAVFLVGSGADVTGDGTCKPSAEQCSFLYLKPGDSVSIVVGDASGALTTYELKLHKISLEKLDEAPGASSSSVKAKTMKQGAQVSKQRTRAVRQKRAERRKARARAKGFFQLFDRLGF